MNTAGLYLLLVLSLSGGMTVDGAVDILDYFKDLLSPTPPKPPVALTFPTEPATITQPTSTATTDDEKTEPIWPSTQEPTTNQPSENKDVDVLLKTLIVQISEFFVPLPQILKIVTVIMPALLNLIKLFVGVSA